MVLPESMDTWQPARSRIEEHERVLRELREAGYELVKRTPHDPNKAVRTTFQRCGSGLGAKICFLEEGHAGPHINPIPSSESWTYDD